MPIDHEKHHMRQTNSDEASGTAAWLRGEGVSSAVKLASLLSQADRGVAELNAIGKDQPQKTQQQALRQDLYWKFREFLYLLAVLFARWLIFAVVTTVGTFAVVLTLGYLIFG
jgi:hypothetical protein